MVICWWWWTCQHWVRWACWRRGCIHQSGSSSKPCKPSSQHATETFIITSYLEQHYHHHLNDDPPDGFHGHGDEGDDSVSDSEVEHQVVNICSPLQVLPGRLLFKQKTIKILTARICLRCVLRYWTWLTVGQQSQGPSCSGWFQLRKNNLRRENSSFCLTFLASVREKSRNSEKMWAQINWNLRSW